MNALRLKPESLLWRRRWLSVLLLVGMGALLGCLFWKFGAHKNTSVVVSIERSALEMRNGVWYQPGQSVPFTGCIVDHDRDGRLRLRSAVDDGLLHGVSIGWSTNGTPELQENFHRGKPEGARTCWYPSGQKRSEGWLSSGLQQGIFREWDEAGTLVVEAEFLDGKPHGNSRAWYPDGSLKAEAVMHHGVMQVRHVYSQGTRWDPAALAASSTVSNTLENK